MRRSDNPKPQRNPKPHSVGSSDLNTWDSMFGVGAWSFGADREELNSFRFLRYSFDRASGSAKLCV